MASGSGKQDCGAQDAQRPSMSSMKDGLKKGLFSVLVFFLATAIRGEWLLVVTHLAKDKVINIFPDTGSSDGSLNSWLRRFGLENLHWMLLISMSVSFVMFYGISGVFQWKYYIKLRHKSELWKCQPKKFLTKENERHEFLMGSLNMFLGSMLSGFMATHVMNGGYNTLYFDPLEKGWVYFVLSIPVFFMYTEATAYYIHRGLHLPLIYRNIHKIHHRYHTPTAFSAVAMHPAEFFSLQGSLVIPMFCVRLHVGVYIGTLLYVYYYGMMDHSGVMMDAIWPWQPPSLWHDNHHRYFHVNFGFNTYFFDWLHDTNERDDREYGETLFYGKGRQKKQR